MAEDLTPLAVSWCNTIGTRNGDLTTDAKMINCFVEKTDNGAALVKRPGSSYTNYNPVTGNAQGIFRCINHSYFIVNNNVYSVNQELYAGGVGLPSPPASTVPFNTLSSGPNSLIPYAVLQAGVYLYTWSGTIATKVTDANYTSRAMQPGIAFLDGVFYAMDGRGQLIGSALNDVTVWPTLDFVQADYSFENGVTVCRHLNYIIAYYTYGTQIYWDANSAPNGQGIALGQVSSGTFQTGCFGPYTVVELNDVNYFVGQTKRFGRTVQMINGLTMQRISTPWVEKILNKVTSTVDQNNLWASGAQIMGHSWYLLTLQELGITLAYNVEMQNWEIWQSTVGTQQTYYQGRFGQVLGGDGEVLTQGSYFQELSTGWVVKLDPTVYQDASGAILVTSVTPNYDYGTLNWKRFGYCNQFADTISTTVGIYYSDNDYQTWSSGRAIDLSTARKQTRNLGSSRRRAWKLTHNDNTPLRVFDFQVSSSSVPR